MGILGRREVLRGAVVGPVIWSIGQVTRIPDLIDLEGRPIHRAADPARLTSLEAEHLIVIQLPPRIVAGQPFKATFSMPNHPSTKNHHIATLRVFLDREMINYVTFAPTWQLPEVTYTLTMGVGGRLDAVADCSTHGLWGASAPLVIEPSEGAAPLSTDSLSAGSAVPAP